MSIPRPEYPRPQWVRDAWLNLNGAWEFEIDAGCSGRARGMAMADSLSQQILVPFCPESRLSGIGHVDFMPCVWYRRTVTLPEAWAGQRVLLHFGAVDYQAEIWVNGQSAGTHRGGYSSFTVEISAFLQPGENVITVCAEDDTRSPLQPTGKQSMRYHSHGCSYTRTTGIWQTVWLEAVPQTYLARPKMTPDLENGIVYIEAPVVGPADGFTLQVEATLNGKAVGVATAQPSGCMCRLALPLSEVQAWSPESPVLYDLTLTLQDAAGVVDRVTSYIGLRSLRWDGPAILLNGMPVFQRLILDQGFYPDGIYTAPSDDELRADIERAQAMGFNGARLHEKVFEERFLYWADKLGYLVWGEMANWGLDLANPLSLERFFGEWRETLARDYNHPALVGWCPFNETQRDQYPWVLQVIWQFTKDVDQSRPVIDASGWVHVATDIYDVHDYEQDTAKFAARYAGELPMSHEIFTEVRGPEPIPVHAPYFVSEYGGIWWNPSQVDTEGWGYGVRPRSEEEFLARFRGLTEVLLNHPRMCGLCYTQLTDVEQEVNGLYTYDRRPKFDPAIIKAILTQPAAVETTALAEQIT